MKKAITSALLVIFAILNCNAQWTSRSMPTRWQQLSFSKSNSTVFFSNSGNFGLADRSILHINRTSLSRLNNPKVLGINDTPKSVVLYSYESAGLKNVGVTYDTFKTRLSIDVISNVIRTVIDPNCTCFAPLSFSLNNNITAYLFPDGNIVASFNHISSGLFVLSPDTVSGVLYSRNNQFIAAATSAYYSVKSFSFPYDNHLGYAAGLAGWIGKTVDSGKSFNTNTISQKRNFSSIHFVDSANGWVIGTQTDSIFSSGRRASNVPVMMYTPNGGINWFDLALDTNYVTEKIKFISPTLGYALFKHRNNQTTYLGRTVNAGQFWSVEWNDNTVTLRDFDVIDSSNIALLGFSNTITGSLYITKGILLGLKPTPSDRLYSATPQPNPTANRFTIPGVGREGVLILVNASGRVVRQESFVPGSEVDISSLPKGLYLFRLVSEGAVTQGKVVRE